MTTDERIKEIINDAIDVLLKHNKFKLSSSKTWEIVIPYLWHLDTSRSLDHGVIEKEDKKIYIFSDFRFKNPDNKLDEFKEYDNILIVKDKYTGRVYYKALTEEE